MIVIADTTPLNYLILIGEVDVLARLYGRVVIPPAVHQELLSQGTPDPVRQWAFTPPSWLDIQSPSLATFDLPQGLGPGEREAIGLAEQLQADQLIVDDLTARREAERRGLSAIGTLGVLREAAEEGLIDLRISLERLSETSFHVSPALIRDLLRNLE
jgi:predicted nucleic acid-binding protein